MVDKVNECEQGGNIHKDKLEKTQLDGSVAESDKFITENDTATKTIDGSYSLLTKLDKAVSTNDAFLDLERALTYEAVFNTLIENKMLAMKRECEERKRSSRLKRSSIGRIFLNRKIFGVTTRKGDSKTSSQESTDKPPHDEALIAVTPERAHFAKPFKTTGEEIEAASTTSTDSNSVRAAETKAQPLAAIAVVNPEYLPNAEDSITSTVSNSSTKRNVLVRAQTHTPAELSGSASGVDNEENGVRTCTEMSRPAHTSTLAEGSLTSLRDSLESLSFANSSSPVLEGEPERLIKRMRLLEARSISAQCSPILPRKPTGPTKEAVVSVATPLPTINRNIHLYSSRATDTATDACSNAQRSSSGVQQFRRSAINDNNVAPIDSIDGNPAHVRFFSRQNTSEESANLTVSTLLNQSDSQSLHVSPSYTNATTVTAAGTMIALNGRLKSRSTSLLVNRRTRVLLTSVNDDITRTPETSGMPSDGIENNNQNVSRNISKKDNRLAVVDAGTSRVQTTEQIRTTDTLTPSTLTGLSSKPATQTSYTANDAIITITSSDGRESKSIMQLHRMASTSTGSSIVPTSCCTTAKSATRDKEKKSFKPTVTPGQSGSDDDRHHKRKYRRYHRCSDPVLVYPTPSSFQHCVLNIVSDDPVQYSLNENFSYDTRIMHKADDLEQIIPKIHRHHHKPRHHHHKKRHRHNRKGKILVQDLETQVVKVIDPHDLSQRARWTIIATACLLLLMCLLLVGITLRMAPIIDDMVRLENDRIKETLDRPRYSKNMTDNASLVASSLTQQIP